MENDLNSLKSAQIYLLEATQPQQASQLKPELGTAQVQFVELRFTLQPKIKALPK